MAESDVAFDTDSSESEHVKNKTQNNSLPKKRCNFCNRNTILADQKPYCTKCGEKCFRECSRCHKPYPSEKYFAKNDRRCNSCQDKFVREKLKREQKNNKKQERDMSSSDDDYPRSSKKIKKENPKSEVGKIVFKNNRNFFLVIYETDDCPE
jgi:hypothetical protein